MTQGDSAQIEQRITLGLAWINGFNTAHPTFNSPQITHELIRRGHVQNLREAHWLGLAMSDDDRKRAKTLRPSMDEWRHHVRIMARLRGIPEAEADWQCREEISVDQLPENIAGGAGTAHEPDAWAANG